MLLCYYGHSHSRVLGTHLLDLKSAKVPQVISEAESDSYGIMASGELPQPLNLGLSVKHGGQGHPRATLPPTVCM